LRTCSVLLLEIFLTKRNAFYIIFICSIKYLFCLWIVMRNLCLCSYLLGEKCEALETIVVVTWNLLLCANIGILLASFTFLWHAKCFDDCILRVWGLLVQFLDVKLDFVDQCVPGAGIQWQCSKRFYSIL